ncbi:hypothetical protein L873DRAFT_1695034, partial [Choiromyces venosus 120613-1]
GTFCWQLNSDLTFGDGKVTIDSAVYATQILDPYLIPFWYKTCEEYDYTQVVEDSILEHQKYATRLWIKTSV